MVVEVTNFLAVRMIRLHCRHMNLHEQREKTGEMRSQDMQVLYSLPIQACDVQRIRRRSVAEFIWTPGGNPTGAEGQMDHAPAVVSRRHYVEELASRD